MNRMNRNPCLFAFERKSSVGFELGLFSTGPEKRLLS